jgi:hypothetical protein
LASSFRFSVHGFQQVHSTISQGPQRVRLVAAQMLWKIVQHVVERGQNNAPILSGDLRANLVGTVEGSSQQPTSPPSSDIIKGKVVDTVPYAMRMHEGFYGLGPISRMQPMTPEGGVGRKYIQRVVDYHMKAYTTAFRNAISSAVGGNVGHIGLSIGME